MSAKEYYALKVRPIYRSYPVHAPGREPAGYRESLLRKEPEIIFDPSKLITKEDWIRAGKVVFESQTAFRPAPAEPTVDPLLPISKEGILAPFRPGGQYIIHKKGVLEVGVNACADCHTRVLPDGRFFEGGQGVTDRPLRETALNNFRSSSDSTFSARVETEWALFGAPWILSKEAFARQLTRDQLLRHWGQTTRGCLRVKVQAGLIRLAFLRSSAFRIVSISTPRASFAIVLLWT